MNLIFSSQMQLNLINIKLNISFLSNICIFVEDKKRSSNCFLNFYNLRQFPVIFTKINNILLSH